MSESGIPLPTDQDLDEDLGDRCTIICALPDHHPGPCKTAEQLEAELAAHAPGPYVVVVTHLDERVRRGRLYLGPDSQLVPLGQARTFAAYADALEAAGEAAASGDGLIATAVHPRPL